MIVVSYRIRGGHYFVKGFNCKAVRKNVGAVDRWMLMTGGRLQELVAMEVYSNYRPIGRGVKGALTPPPNRPQRSTFSCWPTPPRSFTPCIFLVPHSLLRNCTETLAMQATYRFHWWAPSNLLQQGDLRSFFSWRRLRYALFFFVWPFCLWGLFKI